MFEKTYHATHPDMMAMVSNDELRDRYLITGLFRAGEVVLEPSLSSRRRCRARAASRRVKRVRPSVVWRLARAGAPPRAGCWPMPGAAGPRPPTT